MLVEVRTYLASHTYMLDVVAFGGKLASVQGQEGNL